MNLFRLPDPQPCQIGGCPNRDATLVVQTAPGLSYVVCPACVQSMSCQNSDNQEFFAQEPIPASVSQFTKVRISK